MPSFISYAKINLGLKILNKRDDNFHNLHSIFLEVDLIDELVFTPSSTYNLTSEGPASAKFPLDETNLISKAYMVMKKFSLPQTEYDIHIIKKIPIGSGLGGGSSNAAATLIALNNLWGLSLNNYELEQTAKSIGADVPFFIKGGLQLVEGIGDILNVIDPIFIKDLIFVLVVPSIHISTAWAYRILNKTLQPNINRPKFSPLSEPMNWELFENDFERVIHETYPEIGEIKANLKNSEALYTGLSGSGSTVFGVFDNLQKAETILEKFSQYQTFLTSPVFR